MKNAHYTRALLLCCSIGALSVPTLAAAQAGAPQAAPATPDSGDIIVTATRDARNVRDVPMSVNVATGEQLERFKIFDVKDVQQLAPGLELTNSTGRNNTTTLRGITFDPDQGTSPAVQVYYNEIPTDAQTVYTAIYDIQQIEVLRGPQGLLRGLSAPAGAITIATRRPNFNHPEGYAEVTGTNRAGYNAQLGISLPFSDKFAIRVAMLADGNRGNNVRDVNRGDERSRNRTQSARITLGWRPTDGVTGYLTYQYLHADNKQFQQVIGTGGFPYGQYATLFGFPTPFLNIPFAPDTTAPSGPTLGVSDYRAVQDGLFRNENNTHLLNLNVSADLGPATLSIVGAHQFSKLTIARDLDATNRLPGYVQFSTVVTPYKVDTAEVRLTSNDQEGFGWGVGTFYTKQTGVTTVDQDASQFWYAVKPNTVVTVPGVGTFSNTLNIRALVTVPVNSQTWSFSGNLRYKAGPLTIEGGLRYSIIQGVQTTQLALVSAPTNPFDVGHGPTEIIPAALQRNINRPFTGGLNIRYAVTDTLNVYAAYGHSFRAGSTGVSVPAAISNDLIRTQPEKTDSFEVGLKGIAFDRRLNYSVAAYYQKFDNFLSRFTNISYNCPDISGTCRPDAPPINNATDTTNGEFDFNYNADATSKGIEASIEGRVTNNWDIGLSAAYNHARFKNARVPCNDYAGTGQPNRTGPAKVTGTGNVSYCISNGPMAEVPDFGLTANTEIRMPMGSVTPFLRALFTYRPSFKSEQVQYQYLDRELLNLFVGVRADAGWEIDVFARNLLNQQRITNISLGSAPISALAIGSFQSGYRTLNVMNPREFGATLKFKW